MLTSRRLIKRAGISRATLNNYIASGILPKPLVKKAAPGDGSASRIGYKGIPEECSQHLTRELRAHFESVGRAPILRCCRISYRGGVKPLHFSVPT